MIAIAPSTTITSLSWVALAGGPARAATPTMTRPSTGAAVPNAQASTARVATPGTATWPGSSSASAREAGLRRIRSASRYAHAPVVMPVIATVGATIALSAAE